MVLTHSLKEPGPWWEPPNDGNDPKSWQNEESSKEGGIARGTQRYGGEFINIFIVSLNLRGALLTISAQYSWTPNEWPTSYFLTRGEVGKSITDIFHWHIKYFTLQSIAICR